MQLCKRSRSISNVQCHMRYMCGAPSVEVFDPPSVEPFVEVLGAPSVEPFVDPSVELFVIRNRIPVKYVRPI